MNYRIYPPEEILQASIEMPLSKSVSNRALIIAALAGTEIADEDLADCSDTRVLRNALASHADTIDIADAGTAMRFLTAWLATQTGRTVTLDGTERMRQRPIGPLVDVLRRCGAQIEYAGNEGFPPLRITGSQLKGGDMQIDASISSQYISALLMIAPYMEGGLRLTLLGEPASLPYIDLTINMMQQAGIDAERYNDVITVPQGTYSASPLAPEGDWSAASYWYETAALTGGFLTLCNLDAASKQPDRRAMDLFGQLGTETSPSEDNPADLDICGSPDVSPRMVADMSSTPDLTPALAVTCALIGVPFRLTGLQSLRIKETDRIAAIAAELRKIGVITEITGDHTMQWDGRRHPLLAMPEFDTYGDHRMAMAFAPAAIYIPGIVIRGAECVAKSYPGFWDHLAEAGFRIADADEAPETPDGDEENTTDSDTDDEQ